MKRILLAVLVAVAALSAKAQDIYVGGSVGLWHNSTLDVTNFTIAPEVGYNFNEKWAVGVNLGYTHVDKTGVFSLAPYARYSFYENKIVRLFVDGGLGISTQNSNHNNVNGFEIGFKPGLALKLNNHISLVTKFGFLGYRNDYKSEESGYGFNFTSEDLTVGFHYEF